MNCPKCTGNMSPVTFGTVTVDRCDDCKGIWFDMGEVEKLRQFSGSDLVDCGDPSLGKKYDGIRKIDCPKCKVQMIKMVDPQQPHIHFESCCTCYGMFFDAGEYSDLIEDSIVDRVHDFWLKITGQKS